PVAVGRRQFANAADHAGTGGLVVAGLCGTDSGLLARLQNTSGRCAADALFHSRPWTALQHDVRQRGTDLPAARAIVAMAFDHWRRRLGAARDAEPPQYRPSDGRCGVPTASEI